MRINFSFLSNRCVFDSLLLVFNRVFKTVSLVCFFLLALISRVS